MALHRTFTSKVTNDTQKVVIVGIDFGTSYTKVYFNQGGEVKQPLKFDNGKEQTYFLPTRLYYEPVTNKVFFKKEENRTPLKYFKYSMINDDLITSITLTEKNSKLNIKPELLCSIYFLAVLIKEIKKQISSILQTTNIIYSFNMGCPIDNFRDKRKGDYDIALSVGYELSLKEFSDGMTIEELNAFYQQNKDKKYNNLQTISELYAEALWFIEQPSTGEGLYTILDVGGGTADFASILVKRTLDGEKTTTIYSQNVLPLGIEILLQYMYPDTYRTDRKFCISELKKYPVLLPFGWEPKYENDRKLKKAHEFEIKFSSGIGEVKERNRNIMDEQYKKKLLPYYSFGGGADFNWYHSIIASHNVAFSKAGIPPLKRQDVSLENIPNNRLIIAEQLTRSNFPIINGFPWNFSRECIFSGIERSDNNEYITSTDTYFDYSSDLEDIQNARYSG